MIVIQRFNRFSIVSLPRTSFCTYDAEIREIKTTVTDTHLFGTMNENEIWI